MSLALRPVHKVVLTFRDNDAKESSTEVMVPSGTTAANVVTFAAAIVALLVPLSGASLVGYNVIVSFVENALGAIASSDVEDKGFFNFSTANGIRTSIAVPSILESVLQGNNQDIDQSITAVDDFITAMTAGLSSVQPASLSGSDVVGTSSAYKQNRRSHKSGSVRKG